MTKVNSIVLIAKQWSFIQNNRNVEYCSKHEISTMHIVKVSLPFLFRNKFLSTTEYLTSHEFFICLSFQDKTSNFCFKNMHFCFIRGPSRNNDNIIHLHGQYFDYNLTRTDRHIIVHVIRWYFLLSLIISWNVIRLKRSSCPSYYYYY